MKVVFIIAAVLILVFIAFQIYWIFQINKTEVQRYEVVAKGENFEIRHYPSATMATIHSQANQYREFRNTGFRTLAGYIFGGNDAGKQISMTSPVHMDFNDSSSTMSFVMPATLNAADLPKPNDSKISIHQSPDEYVAAIQFGGFASEKDIRAYSDKLENALNSVPITSIGTYRYLGYNPPFQLLFRRNEVVVKVLWDPTKNNKQL
ncbi:MAG: heme-binding protein [Chitinophagales bacterium]|nr:heme-binding protein [Chitinophagales bacterium]